MRVVMRIDEPGYHQPSGCIDDFLHGLAGKIGADRNNLVVFDKNICNRRLMDVAVMVVDLAAPDQRSRHLSLLQCSAPGKTTYAQPEFRSASGESATITRRRCSLVRYGRDASMLAPGTISWQSDARPELAAVFQRYVRMVRSRGLEPPRVAPLAPQASASTNSATTADGMGAGRSEERRVG